MKYFDAFSGYGGFSLGIKQAYENKAIQESEETGEQNIQSDGYISSSSEFIRDGRGASATCIGYSEN